MAVFARKLRLGLNKTCSIYQRPMSINRSPMKKRKIKEHKVKQSNFGVAGRDYFRCGEDAVQFILDLQEKHKNGTAIKDLLYRKKRFQHHRRAQVI